jgi:hypothetical protein
MKRTTLTASLGGSAAAALIAAAIATPAWAQATTYPEGTDCSAISNSASRTECMNQMNESRQNPATGSVVPDSNGSGNIQPGAPNAPDNTPQSPQTNTGTGNPGTSTPGGGTQNAPGAASGPGGGASGVSN